MASKSRVSIAKSFYWMSLCRLNNSFLSMFLMWDSIKTIWPVTFDLWDTKYWISTRISWIFESSRFRLFKMDVYLASYWASLTVYDLTLESDFWTYWDNLKTISLIEASSFSLAATWSPSWAYMNFFYFIKSTLASRYFYLNNILCSTFFNTWSWLYKLLAALS